MSRRRKQAASENDAAWEAVWKEYRRAEELAEPFLTEDELREQRLGRRVVRDWSYLESHRKAKTAIRNHGDEWLTFADDLTSTSVPIFERALAETHRPILRPHATDAGTIENFRSFNAQVIERLKRQPIDVFQLSSRQFEELIAEILAGFGWQVHLSRATKDGGYDIFGIHRDKTGLESPWLVECKRFSPDRPVGIEIVRSFWAVKTDLSVPNGLIATTSHFTRGAEQFKASRWDLTFRDLNAIVDWVNEYKPNDDGSLYIQKRKLLVNPHERRHPPFT